MLLHICECSCIREQGRKQDLTGGVGALSFWHQISLQLGKRGANILVKTGAIIFFFMVIQVWAGQNLSCIQRTSKTREKRTFLLRRVQLKLGIFKIKEKHLQRKIRKLQEKACSTFQRHFFNRPLPSVLPLTLSLPMFVTPAARSCIWRCILYLFLSKVVS